MIADKIFQNFDAIHLDLIRSTDLASGRVAFFPSATIDPKHLPDQKQFGKVAAILLFIPRHRVNEALQPHQTLFVLLQALDDELEPLRQRDRAAVDGEQIFEQSIHGGKGEFRHDVGAVDVRANIGVPADGDVGQRTESGRRRVAISADFRALQRRRKISVVLIEEERHGQQRGRSGAQTVPTHDQRKARVIA